MDADHVYFDTSGAVKLVLLEEKDAEVAVALRRDADTMYTSWLSYPEITSALARTHRDGQITAAELEAAYDTVEALWDTFVLIDLSPAVARRAAELVKRYPLSGADAVHLASALEVRIDAPLTFASWDTRQREAAEALGLPVPTQRD